MDGPPGQFLNGNGTAPNLHGITLTSGIQTRAFVTDRITTARYALGDTETLGYTGGGFFVLNPVDWLAIEVSRSTTNGDFLMQPSGSPVDNVRRRLWGQPVTLSTNVTAGTGCCVANGAASLFHDGTVDVSWGTIADAFGRNEVRARVEGRFQAGALRPSGIVKMTGLV